MNVEDRFINPGNILSGSEANQIIRTWHNNTLNTIFPSHSTYA